MKKAAHLLTLLAALSFVLSTPLSHAQSAPDSYLHVRSGLPHVLPRLKAGKPVSIVYFGASVTEGAGASSPATSYPGRFTQSIRTAYPQAQVTDYNAALGGTGPILGAFRLQDDVLSHAPDLVIIEFAINDWTATKDQVFTSMEGIIRHLRRESPKTDLVFLYAFVQGHMDTYKQGQMPKAIGWHEVLAERYHIPSINLSAFVAGRMKAGKITADQFAPDGVHPTDEGTALYLEGFRPLMASAGRSGGGVTALPSPLSAHPRDRGQMISPTPEMAEGAWKTEPSPVTRFPSVFASDVAGASLRVTFTGDCIGVFDAPGPDGGDFDASVDGGPWRHFANFQPWCVKWYAPDYQMIAEGLDPAKTHTVRLKVSPETPPESKGRFTRIGYLLINGRQVTR